MKKIIFTAFLVFLLFSPISFAQVQYYEINSELTESGKSYVNIIVTFARPESEFDLSVIGGAYNLQAKSLAGPIICETKNIGISSISCKMNLTMEKRQVELSFETDDFVRVFDNKYFFSGDFNLDKEVKQVFASLTLPQNSFLVGENITESRISYPENATAFISEPSRIRVVWRLSNIKANEPLKFEILYEQIQPPIWFELRMRHFLLFGAAFAIVLGFIIIKYYRKSEELVLSVLDEYERKVMDIIANSEGSVDQKKVVELTNLSKAKISRVVKNLVERGLIEAERLGRKNKLKLIEKKFKQF